MADELIQARIFFVPGVPHPMPRPRAVRVKRHVHIYNPSGPWEDWRKEIQAYACMHAARIPWTIHDAAEVELMFRLPSPESLAKKRRGYFCGKRPDIDNYAKVVLDALTRAGVWPDDGIVAILKLRKSYALRPEDVGVVVDIRVITQD